MTKSSHTITMQARKKGKDAIEKQKKLQQEKNVQKKEHLNIRKKQQEQLAIGMFDYRKALEAGVTEYLNEFKKHFLETLLQAEVNDRAGLPYERNENRDVVRWGSEKGSAILDGGKVEITRPRLRLLRGLAVGHGEVKLEMYKAMNRADLIDGPLTAAVLAGVSSRNYAKLVCKTLNAKGVKKSTVSRKTIEATKPTVDQFLKRRLDSISATVLFIDGVHVAKRMALACIAIDSNGKKHVIGVHLGASESQIVCRDLIRDMIERGLDPNGKYLFVIDGSKALAQSIRAAFGQHAHIQRCQEHKIRDVQAYLPFKERTYFRHKLQAAYGQKTEQAALNQLGKIRSELSLISEKACNSLTEGLYETVTVHRLGITGLLRKSLRTTNIVESAFSSVRRYMGRVGRFRDEAQRDLWLIRSLVEAERHFRGLDGHRQISALRKKLAEPPHS